MAKKTTAAFVNAQSTSEEVFTEINAAAGTFAASIVYDDSTKNEHGVYSVSVTPKAREVAEEIYRKIGVSAEQADQLEMAHRLVLPSALAMAQSDAAYQHFATTEEKTASYNASAEINSLVIDASVSLNRDQVVFNQQFGANTKLDVLGEVNRSRHDRIQKQMTELQSKK